MMLISKSTLHHVKMKWKEDYRRTFWRVWTTHKCKTVKELIQAGRVFDSHTYLSRIVLLPVHVVIGMGMML